MPSPSQDTFEILSSSIEHSSLAKERKKERKERMHVLVPSAVELIIRYNKCILDRHTRADDNFGLDAIEKYER